MTTATLPPPATATSRPDRRDASLATSAAAVAARTIRKFVRTPQLIVLGAIQGVTFLLIFRYVFGGAISVAGVPYVDFLVPGFITTGVLFAGMSAAAGVAEDLEQGFFDRLRSLPIPRASVLAWSSAMTVVFGFVVGFRLHGGIAGGLTAFALCVLCGFAFSWVFITIGLYAGNAQAAQGMSLLVFPLTFVSSAYVPVASMPGWLQAFAERQPMTVMVDAVRSLTLGDRSGELLGHTTSHYVTQSILWSAALVIGFAPIAINRYRRG
jgi:ABC-2 type transport system permease protein